MKNSSFVIALLVLLSGCGEVDIQKDSTASFETLVVTKSDIVFEQDYAASIEGKQSIKIIPRVDGYLTQVHIKEGQRIKRGQVLFTMDQSAYISEVKSAEADVAIADVAVSNAKLKYDSRKKLYDKGIVSDFDLQLAYNELKMFEAQLLQKQAILETAKNNLSYTILKSPSDGIVGTILYRNGDYVSPTMQNHLTTIADDSQMYVYFSLAEQDIISRIQQQGSFEKVIESFPSVSIKMSNNKIYPIDGKVESISGVVESSTGALSARAVFPNPNGILLSGSSGRIIVPIEYNDVIVIPKAATYDIMNKIHVFKVINGIAHSAIIEVMPISDNENYVVTKGLNEKDIIVAKGAGYVKDGMKISTDK